MKRKNSGITLIALVITIILLLILAGVALSMVAGNEGILTKAETAVSETEIAGAKEQAELMLAELSADYYEKKFVDKTVSGSLVDYIEDELSEGKTTSNGEFSVSIDGSGNVSVKDKNGNQVISGTLDENGKTSWSESSGGNGSGVLIPEGLEVGATVTYAPSGTYNWKAKYASSDLADDGTADVLLASGTEVTTENQDMSITTWKVFLIDEATGKIDLVPSAPTTGKVRLQGAQGYNNAVKLLNDACSDLYGNSSKGISARSINIEDIEGKMTEEALTTARGNKYEKQIEEVCANAYTLYPEIYTQEELSVINGVEIEKGQGLAPSEQNVLFEPSASKRGSGLQPYYTAWGAKNTILQTAFKAVEGFNEQSGTINTYYNLLIQNAIDFNYWIASRCISYITEYRYCDYGVRYGSRGGVWSEMICGSDMDAPNAAYGLFPILTLNANLLSGNVEAGWEIN